MHWASVADFLAMGGYGAYVWGSVAACALGLGLDAALALRRHARARAAAGAAR